MQKTAVNFDHLSMVAEVIVFNGCAQGGYHGGVIEFCQGPIRTLEKIIENCMDKIIEEIKEISL